MQGKMHYPLLIFTFAILFSCTSGKDEKNKEQASVPEPSTVNEYPPLTLTLVNGEQVAARELQGKNVFFLFQPDCSHCQEEAAQVAQRLDDFKNYSLYFISSAPMEQISAFAHTYELADKGNVKFAWASTEGVLAHYGAIRTPSVYIYSDGALKKSFNGQTDIENILNAL